MLPTFVIGLREGLEAALIVGIVAAFLRQQGRRDLLRWVWVGVAASTLLCLAVGIVLRVVSQNLPQRQQEGLETVIGAVAVGMVTYMVVWMRRHSRDLKGQLTTAAGAAMAAGSGYALVAMAFLAVLREGFETVVFLLAAFNESTSGASAGVGALLGILVAVVLGYGIYRGGVRINLSKFFRATGVVLVLVAAGLVVNALHTAHEAGWLNIGQQSTVDLTGVVRPGSVQASLLTGMLGIQEHPVLIEVVGWLVYLIPVGLYIAWPPGRAPSRATVARYALGSGAVLAVATVVLAVVAPGRPVRDPALEASGFTARITARVGDAAQIEAGAPGRAAQTLTAQRTGAESHNGQAADVYTATVPGAFDAASLPATVSVAEVAQANGGRLPLGAHVTGDSVPVRYTDSDTATFWVEPHTGRVVDVRWREVVARTATLSTGPLPLGTVHDQVDALPRAAAAQAVRTARHGVTTLDRHRTLTAIAAATGVVGAVALITAALYALAARRRRPATGAPTPTPELVSG
ncbi:MAG TPA: iron uptake transporter permease EfeU [Jatrophihabitantaceae bacterium]|jgi:high-affinity iron transporter